MPINDNNADYRTIAIGLVDDHILLRKGLAAMFADRGMTVTMQADNGQRLVEQWTTTAVPEVMLVDVNMPVMDGYATTRWLRAQHPQVKILALSIKDDVDAVRQMIACGADGYVLKDAHPKELLHAVHTVIEKGFFMHDQLNKQLIAGVAGKGEKTYGSR